MPPRTVDEKANDSQPAHPDITNDHTSVLIFISAQALGSLGFAVSLLAIWFGWLLPASTSEPTTLEALDVKKPRIPSKHHRRSIQNGPATTPPPTPMRRASAPVNLTPILVPRPEEFQGTATPRRVYFSDSPPAPIVRRNTMPEPKNYAEQQFSQPISSSTITTPASLAALLPRVSIERAAEYVDETAPDSDSSKASLLKPSSRLRKLKLGFQVKGGRSEALDKQADQASITSTETAGSDKARRASGGFVASWTLSRNRTMPDTTTELTNATPSRLSFSRRLSPSRPMTSPGSGTPVSPDILSPTFLSRRAQKRVSAPIPRTSPYGAPYFATPPLLLNTDNSYPAYLKTLPQFEDEVPVASLHASECDDAERSRGRTSSIRRVKLNSAMSCCTKRRSASADFTKSNCVAYQ